MALISRNLSQAEANAQFMGSLSLTPEDRQILESVMERDDEAFRHAIERAEKAEAEAEEALRLLALWSSHGGDYQEGAFSVAELSRAHIAARDERSCVSGGAA